MNGGIRIEGDEITIYKKITKIQSLPQAEVTAQIQEEQEWEDIDYDTQAILHECYTLSSPAIGESFRKEFAPVILELQQQGFIGEEPLKHWAKNGELCKIEVINPDITIQDKPLKHVTPTMEDSFKRHVDTLLQLGVIRPSKSRHRTMAMLVNSGTTVDPKTGLETKGKERMVFNYRTLNDNTFKDQYSLPGINTLLKRIANSKVYSKFDLKSGFHQVAMEESSIPWTAFIVPGGLYEWLVMPFGLKNAPAIFQRKMDKCFRGTEKFIAVYIDDILVFSENEKEHAKHLKVMVEICKRNGLVLSPTKMKIAVPEVEFLGAVIGKQRIKLQTHIIKKIVEFDEERLKSKAGLRSFLGILNYARSYIPKLGTLLGPLYEKTGTHGDKRLKPSDYELIHKIKRKVQELPDLEIPPENAYIILETDGCMEGWGGVCKWKKKRDDPISTEKVCAYASGRFKTMQSTIDAEIYGCINTLEKLKIYYLDQKEITLRTDCQAIISFHNKTNSNKASRVRWMKFADAVTGTGVQINFEHVNGKQNVLADTLSRLINFCIKDQEGQEGITNLMNLVQEILNEGPQEEKLRLMDLFYAGYAGKKTTNTECTEECTEETAYPLAPRYTQEEPLLTKPNDFAKMNMAQFREAHEKERTCKTRWYEGDTRDHPNPQKWEWFGTRYGAFAIQKEANPKDGKLAQEIIARAKRESPVHQNRQGQGPSPQQNPQDSLDQKMKGLMINCLVENRPNYQYHPIHGLILEDDAMNDEDEEEDTCESYTLEDEGWDDSTLEKIGPQLKRTNIRGARYSRL